MNPRGTRAISVELSKEGSLAYVPGHLIRERALSWEAPGAAPQPLPFVARFSQRMDLSPDGRRVAVASSDSGTYVISILDIERGTEERLEFAGNNWLPLWHPDGERLAFQAMRNGNFDIHWVDLGDTATDEPLLTDDADELLQGWSSDGTLIVFSELLPDGSNVLRTVDVTAPESRQTLADQSIGKVDGSPDGRWIAVEKGINRLEIYVRPFQAPGPEVRVSADGGEEPHWSPADNRLFYLRGDAIMAVSYRVENDRFVVDRERVVIEVPQGLSDFDVSPDASRFLLLHATRPADPLEMRVVLGWDRELARTISGRKD